MAMSPPHATWSSRFHAWRPTTRGMLLILGAVALGLVLFLVATRGQRGATPSVPPTAARGGDTEFAPLPAPMPADAAGASGLEEPDEDALAERPRIIERPRPAERPAPTPDAADARAPLAASVSAVPISSPAPRYPSRAMQRRETGTVRLQVQVGVDGRPTDVRVLESSRSRDLDRAALDAVRRWRFQPAQRDGRPVADSVVVPISFRL